jgi:predicted PurR-regulated permease PerM
MPRPALCIAGDVKPSSFSRRILTATLIILIAALVSLVFWSAKDVFLLIFAGVLGAVFLRAPSTWLHDKLKVSYGSGLAIVVLGLAGILSVAAVFFGPDVVLEADKFVQLMPRTPEQLQAMVEEYEWGRNTLGRYPGIYQEIFDAPEQLFGSTQFWLAPVQFLSYMLFVLFVSFYFAIEPKIYKDGLVEILPRDKRGRGRQIVSRIASTLRWFLVARFASMLVVGVFTTITLYLFQIPLALVLGILAGLLTFVPYLGPLVATAPILLVSLGQGPDTALWVLVVYGSIQLVEGYILTPVFQKLTVYVPPAMTLVAEVLMGVLFGTLGIIIAAPFTAFILVFYQLVYRENVLGEQNAAPQPGKIGDLVHSNT